MSLDFSNQNLRGRSFKDQNLEGANFSHADIRGTNFSHADLTGANFSYAKAGTEDHWIIILMILSVLLSAGSGLFSGLAYRAIEFFLNLEATNHIALWLTLLTLIGYVIFSLINITKGEVAGLWTLAIVTAVDLLLAVGIGGIKGSAAVLIAIVIIAFSVLLGALAGAVARAAFESYLNVIILIIISMGVIMAGMISSSVAEIFMAIVAGLSAFTGWFSFSQQQKHILIKKIAIYLTIIKGTKFRNANLTDANFTAATLKSTDFRQANLIRTCFNKTIKLDRVCPGTTYLQNAQVRQVLVTGQKPETNFEREDLRGVNFQGANLVDASFIGADLSQANLQNADLSRAKLVQTQLTGTDLTRATLTGAYIQDWGITTDTKFDGVRCEYVYMRLPTKQNPEPLRKPDNNKEVFADGEFGDFIKPIFDTLDLYHNQGVDPRAIAISLKQLAENHPDADLRIVGMEVRGEDNFLLRAKTAATADKSELSAEYFDTYNQLKGLPEGEIKLLLAEKDNQIRRLENMIMTALERPNFYSNTQVGQVSTMTSNPGGFSVGGSVGGHIRNVQGDNNKVVQGDTTMTGNRNINTGGGNYNERIERDYIQGNYYAAGQPQSLAQAAAEIQLLLKQLEQTYPTTTTPQKMVVAAEVVNCIESNPLLKKRVINAVKEGGLAAFEKAIDNPAGAFIVGAIKGWQEVEAED
ncbi:pentapeptide repeat-containing protein [Nostoc sp. FACHB-133]|uniref:pentapeptide repeat-containing protein n=1 Tax=Nostoc sp. FACHB-133 TaxID=2692835 RepID=UPI0016847809|nr:pentapeptide repeat-containing protein [Nostoc sp. FACHB-133]MBD2525645.1 pentapeptide repeat-containing protein [Nostoc sp. FACHB-133]